MQITADFDGGAIEVLHGADPRAVELGLRGDTGADVRQWFCVRFDDVAGQPLVVSLTNAAEATYAEAFDGYRVCASYEGERWFRVPTRFDGSVLCFEHTPAAASVTYAYFAPYPWQRHLGLVEAACAAPGVALHVPGLSALGRPMHVLVVDAPEAALHEARAASRAAPRRVWLIARQHPGETMGEWLAEGLLARLLDATDPVAVAARRRAVFHVVPNMNPDGGVLGNQRTNALGADLNRAWLAPSADASPEVLCVRAAMEDSGVDLFLDVHGDERNPWCFLAGCEGNPGYSERLRFLENLFEQTLLAASRDFQDEYGYPRDEPGGGDLRTAGNWVGERFGCLSFTLEMPFKDNANDPDPRLGWSPTRSMELGASLLEAILVCLDWLDGEPPGS
ncbi:MAG: carboxypeptidase family protein [Myxococcales bacterium]|nr:carboxypeptidase family protein [Myxococcales bacterium]